MGGVDFEMGDWYPFTDYGKVFLKLLKKHFPASHVLHKIFNKNTVKSSYSCMKTVISPHNKSILNPRIALLGCNLEQRN